jgi:hypothetical protein
MDRDRPMVRFSCAILHAPWKDDRVKALEQMLGSLDCSDLHPEYRPTINIVATRHDLPWPKAKTLLALEQWEWALRTTADCHVFLTDDLHLAPGFWQILDAMCRAKPDSILGLLSNHPKGSLECYENRWPWYKCNSWIVGPAYVVPRHHLERFVLWYKSLPDTEEPKCRQWFNDDSALNEWISNWGPGESLHPVPTPIEHRGDLPSTVGHGDEFSRERISWRSFHWTEPSRDDASEFIWRTKPLGAGHLTETGETSGIIDCSPERMTNPEYWKTSSDPMYQVGK